MTMTPPDRSPAAANGSYDARNITVLPGLEAVRKNPSMYIGSTDQEGLHRLVYEVVDNAIDESLAGYCSRIRVIIGHDGSCSVEDDGRGIPVDDHPELACPACQVVLTTLHAGGKFDQGSYFRSAGIHGVGVSCVNALSSWLELDIWRANGHYIQRYEVGKPVTALTRKHASARRGTRVRFLPDATIFDTTEFSHSVLARRLEELAFLHPGIHIQFDDLRQGSSQIYQYDSGILGFIARLNAERTPLHRPPMSISHKDAELEIDLALQWTTAYGEEIASYVNSINTVWGGTHVNGLKRALTRSINAYATRAGLLNADNGERIATFDILEGLTCVLSVRMHDPRFEGQTKTRLTSRAVREVVDEVVGQQLDAILAADAALARVVVGRALDASRARLAARRASDRARYTTRDIHVSDEVYQKQFGIRSRNWHKSAEWIANEALLAKHAEAFELPEGARLLDVCCGSGVVGNSFTGLVSEKIGLDITPEMVELASQRLDKVVQGTVYDIPFEDDSFDIVCTREVLHLLPNPGKPVSEIFRVLKPGGQFVVGQILPFSELDGPWMYRVFKKKQPLIFNMFQEEDFRRMLLGAGFVDLKMSEFNLWESIDVWIDTHETTSLHRHEIRDLFHNAPAEARAVHPFEILPSGEIRDLWRWCIFSVRKPG
jgi:DNA gyrase subunit B